jgi:hypothetical protein
MTKNQQREKSLKKNKQTRLWPVERKEKQQKQNNADISPVYKQGVFSTKDTKKNKIKLKTNKTTTKKKNKNVQSAQTNPRREKMLI